MARRRLAAIAFVAVAIVAGGCGDDSEETERSGGTLPPPEDLEVTTDSFSDGETLPTRFTCDGEGAAPSLEWSGVPDGTAAIAVTVTDPDAPSGSFVHWVVFDIDPATDAIRGGDLPDGAVEAEGSGGEVGWTPACPPPGSGPHRYVFSVYALNAELGFDPGVNGERALDEIREKAIAKGDLTATYER